MEYYDVFNEKALDFIKTFNCSDFTRNIVSDLVRRGRYIKAGL